MSDVDTPSGSLEETEKKLEWMDVDYRSDENGSEPVRRGDLVRKLHQRPVPVLRGAREYSGQSDAGSNITGSTVGWRSEESSRFFGFFSLF